MKAIASCVPALVVLFACVPATAHPGHGEESANPVQIAARPPGERGPTDGAASSASSAGPSVTIDVRDGYRYITSNGIPNHTPGRFPNRSNPNAIAPQMYAFRVPIAPTIAQGEPREARGVLFGVALNGVVFDPGTAEFWRDDPSLGWRMEAIGGPRNLGLDASNAHVQPSGAYHYHGVPKGLIETLPPGGSEGRAKTAAVKTQSPRPTLIGWAADGFPIYGPLGYADATDPASALKPLRSSYRLKEGRRPAQPDAPGGAYDGAYTRDWECVDGAGDLDACNGRVGVTAEFPRGTYYYVITEEFPFIPRLLRGTPDESFRTRRGPGGAGGRGGPDGPEGRGGAGRPRGGDGSRPPPPPPS